MIQKPQILTLNLTDKANKALKDNDFNIYTGSLGNLVDTKNKKHEHKYCLLNYDFPSNIHEFDIFIIDLSNESIIPYNKADNTRIGTRSKNNTYLLCEYPQTIFDPRGYASYFLKEKINDIKEREIVIIVIQNEDITFKYELVEENGLSPRRLENKEVGLYEFMPKFPLSKNKFGKETKVAIKANEINSFFEKYNKEFFYENTFYHPTIWKDEENIPNPSFYPLVSNRDDEIISFAYFETYGLYVFPKMKDNSNFILEFIQSIAPSIHPKLFPFSTENKWTLQSEYSLPNHQKLLDDKLQLEKDFRTRIHKKKIEIKTNNEKYKFLHDILTETGDNLVKSVIKFLEWMEFENIKDVDEENQNKNKEEDIQIENDNGLLVIEVKGIGGTSKDSECSQISKIKYRRAKERGSFDVFGLYLVNHQRHLPPLDRENPPFTKEQLDDAINDERGLLTTWQLFNLYKDVQKGLISKQEARESLYEYGFINFRPQNLSKVDMVKETFKNGYVSILNINDTPLKVGEKIITERKGVFDIAEILEIKINNENVESATDGEIGIKTDIKVLENTQIWKKNLP